MQEAGRIVNSLNKVIGENERSVYFIFLQVINCVKNNWMWQRQQILIWEDIKEFENKNVPLCTIIFADNSKFMYFFILFLNS